MKPDINTFLAVNAINLIFVMIASIRILFAGTANLRAKFTGLLFMAAVLYVSYAVRVKWLGPDTPLVWYFVATIVTRLIALKIIFAVIDADE